MAAAATVATGFVEDPINFGGLRRGILRIGPRACIDLASKLDGAECTQNTLRRGS